MSVQAWEARGEDGLVIEVGLTVWASGEVALVVIDKVVDGVRRNRLSRGFGRKAGGPDAARLFIEGEFDRWRAAGSVIREIQPRLEGTA